LSRDHSLDRNHFVSVILVNFNGINDLKRCLPSLFKTDYENFETIIIDNGSTDGSLQCIKELAKKVNSLTVVESGVNLGFAVANNEALKYAKGEFIVLLNCDTIVTPGWLRELVNVIANDKSLGVVQSKLLFLNKPEIIDSMGDIVHPAGSSISRGMGEKDVGQYDKIHRIFSARGAAVIIRRDIILETGLFDPTYFMTYEDIDFCWRARLFGYEIALAPKSVVYHRGFDAYNEVYLMKMFNTFKNQYMMLIKNYETKNVLRFVSQLAIYHSVKVFTYLFTQVDLQGRKKPFTYKVRIVVSLIKAPIYILNNLPSIWTRRVDIQQRRKVNDKAILKAMSPLPLSVFLFDMRKSVNRKWSNIPKQRKQP
jgi:GT2 family glycosyltransferase